MSDLNPEIAQSENVRRARAAKIPVPPQREVISRIPKDCFNISLLRSSIYLFISVGLTLGLGGVGYLFIPMTWAWLPVWIAYAIITGTVATGCWVIAHECGHGAFARQKWVQDTVGFVLHSALLVPYYSWQRSHAVHHSKTNHLDEGETFVPLRQTTKAGKAMSDFEKFLGDDAFAIFSMLSKFLIGWPLYLLVGLSGGPKRGITNHFWPLKPFATSLFPRRMHTKMWISDLGVIGFLGVLVWWAVAAGSIVPVLALYVGPYLVVNFWLILYTWLQHTDVDVPHFDESEWSWTVGAFSTVDRPYGPILNFLHHNIGSTHVAHHINSRIPHYHARRATAALRDAYPDLYKFDPTPIPQALWRIAKGCNVVYRADTGWKYTPTEKQAK
ncbi:MAG: fatty acid desaturase [Opitutales bacterium]